MTNASQRELAKLRSLARLYGVQTSYLNMDKSRVQANPDAMLAALRALGASVDSVADAPRADLQRLRELWSWRLDPVSVAWEGEPQGVSIRLPGEAGGRAELELSFETGGSTNKVVAVESLAVSETRVIDGKRYVARRIDLVAAGLVKQGKLPLGYHDLAVTIGERRLQCLLLAAPRRFFAPARQRRWGTFLPLYALHSQRSWGVGDVTDLERLVELTAREGGDFIATLPILASFLDQPFEPSPYVPVSRLFWNELYADPARRPGTGADLRDWPRVASLLNDEDLVPYRAAMALKRQAMDFQMGNFIASDKGRRQLDAFLEAKPETRDYARFRAAVERLGPDWRHWPEQQRNGGLTSQDYDPRAVNYHAFAQWRIDTQLRDVAATAKTKGVGLYLDMPIGVHADGYDAWRYRELFVDSTSVGAPPDIVTTSGQDWGFPPLNPEALRQSGYSYLRAYLHHHLRVARVLRLDHVMGLHRLYWIPAGGSPTDGLYVRYPFEELYAVHSLESHRHQAVIAGEDLGIVPNEVARNLDRHRVVRLYVLEISLYGPPEQPFFPIPRRVAASIGTHDLPPFESWWQDLDIEGRKQLGVLNEERAAHELSERAQKRAEMIAYLRDKGLLALDADGLRDVLAALLKLLGASDAEWVVVNMEDVWLETMPQNVPGTTAEQHPNWRHRARYSLEEMEESPEIKEALLGVREARRAATPRLRKRGRE